MARIYAAIAAGEHATPSDVELTKKIFSAVGLAVSIEESKLDAVYVCTVCQ
mgnify:CR=1 FL=1